MNVLMVSTLRFRSIKTIHLGWTRSYLGLFIAAAVIAAIASSPRVALVVLAYAYLVSAFVGYGWTRFRRYRQAGPATAKETSVKGEG